MCCCDIGEIFNKTFFCRTPPVAASKFVFTIEVVEDAVNHFGGITCYLDVKLACKMVFPNLRNNWWEDGLFCSFSSHLHCRLRYFHTLLRPGGFQTFLNVKTGCC